MCCRGSFHFKLEEKATWKPRGLTRQFPCLSPTITQNLVSWFTKDMYVNSQVTDFAFLDAKSTKPQFEDHNRGDNFWKSGDQLDFLYVAMEEVPHCYRKIIDRGMMCWNVFAKRLLSPLIWHLISDTLQWNLRDEKVFGPVLVDSLAVVIGTLFVDKICDRLSNLLTGW